MKKGALNISIFPNPTSDKTILNIYWPDNYPDGCKLTLRGFNGSIVYQRKVKLVPGKNLLELDLSNYSDGLYLINLISKRETLNSLLVKHNR